MIKKSDYISALVLIDEYHRQNDILNAKVEEPKEVTDEGMFKDVEERIVPIKASHAKSKTVDGKATVTGALTPAEIEVIEEGHAIPIEEPQTVEKITKKVEKEVVELGVNITSPKTPEDSKLKKEGKPYYNRRGVLITPEGYVDPLVAEAIKEEEDLQVEAYNENAQVDTKVIPLPPLPTSKEQVIASGEGLEVEEFSIEEIILSDVNPLQEQFDRISKLALANDIKLGGFIIEQQSKEKLDQLEVALANHIKNKK